MKKVVIVGGGFAGLNLGKKLVEEEGVHVTMVDKNNYHFFPPLIYQVSTSFIEPSNISYPFRKIFQERTNFGFHYGGLKEIIPGKNKIVTSLGEVEYDILVLAMGAETNYFNMESVKKNALPMKNISDAIKLRNHILEMAERATITEDIAEREKFLNIVIAGGGPTGVELAGMLAYMSRNILKKEYPELHNRVTSKIYLIDAADSLLSAMSEKSQKNSLKNLHKLGVVIKLGTAVKGYENEEVILGDGSTLRASTLIWASGIVAMEAGGIPAESIGRGRRIIVDETNKVLGAENIYAIGDQCLQTSDANFPNGHPQVAQVAIQHGNALAANLVRLWNNRPTKPFAYGDKGSMAIISKSEAVVDFPNGAFLSGFIAWLIWLFIHIIPIAGFRNKYKLAANWFWSFLTNDPNLRLIIKPKI